MSGSPKRLNFASPQFILGDSWVKPYFVQYKKLLALALFLGIIAAVFSSALMVTAGYLISASATAPGAIMLLQFPLIFIRVFGVGRPPIKHVERYVSHDWVFKMSSLLRCDLWLSLGNGKLTSRSKNLGNILGLLSSDIAHIQNLYLRCIFPSVIAFTLYLIVLLAAGLLSLPLLLGLCISLSIIVFVFPLWSVLVNGARSIRRRQLERQLYDEMTDSCLGIVDLQCSTRKQQQKDRLGELCHRIDELRVAELRFDRCRNMLAQLLFVVSILAILYSLSSHFSQGYSAFSLTDLNERLNFPSHWIAAWTLGFLPVIELFSPLSNSALEALRHMDSIEALNRLERVSFTETVQTMSAPPQELSEDFDISASPLIDVHGLSFSYPASQTQLLKDISLSINKGDKLAILGRSGVGKSSFISLLLGEFEPSEGQILLGGTPAHKLSSYHKYVAVLEQQSYLFNTTLAENLRITAPEASDEELYEVLRRVGLEEKLKSLPQGLYSMVQEAGFDLSGGERHRLCLARVLLQNCPIVVLDEPTAGLDVKTEQAVLDTIFEVFKDSTLLIVTHQLSLMRYVDKLIFFSQGKLAFQGSPQQLEKSNEYYQRLLTFDTSVDLEP